MKKRVLLSIHPKHADAIFAGRKGYEFRRVLFKQDVVEIVVYATSPVSRVVGSFKIKNIHEDNPSQLWARTKEMAGVEKELFDSYFKNRQIAFGIEIENPVLFPQSERLSKYVASNKPPQSFCYIQ